ncbi:helix-turn-helix transcriptional regulator [uncultured Streptococcus sp.]|uniref:helix-turn-helix domain-containing protein n=1 Tax=uncultured Streptococcus sp. TaxID=83427 RepID=UPI002675254B|nr:helix-turn-helix transcriptional regulator [uncultured Streptococcus sp.]
MIIDTEKIKEILLDRSVTGYALWKATGVSQQAISRLRSGKKRFEDLSVETVEKVQRWLNKED